MADDDAGSASREPSTSERRLERAWEAADGDPDLEDDLGYDGMALDVLVTSNSDKKVMFLPRSEEALRDDAYIVADFDLAVDPVERT